MCVFFFIFQWQQHKKNLLFLLFSEKNPFNNSIKILTNILFCSSYPNDIQITKAMHNWLFFFSINFTEKFHKRKFRTVSFSYIKFNVLPLIILNSRVSAPGGVDPDPTFKKNRTRSTPIHILFLDIKVSIMDILSG